MNRDGDRDDGLFDDFDSDWELDDPDRDSDFAAIYHEDEPEDEPPYFEDPDDGDAASIAEADVLPVGRRRLEDLEAAQDNDRHSDPDSVPPVTLPPLGAYTTAAEPAPIAPDDDDDDAYEDEDDDLYDDYADEPAAPTFPLGLIIVGVVALGLLAFGGYGVVQQRAALQEDVRQLQSRLATTASPAEVAKTRAANETLQARNTDLEARLVSLERENRTLQATVAGLEKQLSAQQQALQRSPAASAAPAPEPDPEPAAAPAPQPEQRTAAPPASSAPAASGDWFVNFGSYGQEDIARQWADRLQPASGRVIVTTGEKDGRTFYRVRVVGLSSRDAANATARDLERKYGLDRLWVGKSD
jgi:cell division septation protein DedD